MRHVRIALIAAAVAALTTGAIAHEAGVDTDAMQHRFEQMDRMAEQAHGMHGAQLDQTMLEHMEMMQQQMAGMHGMYAGHGGMMMRGGGMGSGMRQGSGAGPGSGMSPGMMKDQDSSMGTPPNGATADRFAAMQQRMDAMQQMMEQMLDQQQLMLQKQSQ